MGDSVALTKREARVANQAYPYESLRSLPEDERRSLPRSDRCIGRMDFCLPALLVQSQAL